MEIKINTILPRPFNGAAFRREAGNAVLQAVEDSKKDFDKVTATWRNRPTMISAGAWRRGAELPYKFRIHVGPDPRQSPEYEIFGYVDQGTRPHRIVPRRARALAFIWGGPGSYRPKTRPGFLGSTAGGPTGSLVFRKWVRHPGTKARNFSDLIGNRWSALIHVRLADAMVRAADASGHAYR